MYNTPNRFYEEEESDAIYKDLHLSISYIHVTNCIICYTTIFIKPANLCSAHYVYLSSLIFMAAPIILIPRGGNSITESVIIQEPPSRKGVWQDSFSLLLGSYHQTTQIEEAVWRKKLREVYESCSVHK